MSPESNDRALVVPLLLLHRSRTFLSTICAFLGLKRHICWTRDPTRCREDQGSRPPAPGSIRPADVSLSKTPPPTHHPPPHSAVRKQKGPPEWHFNKVSYFYKYAITRAFSRGGFVRTTRSKLERPVMKWHTLSACHSLQHESLSSFPCNR